MPEFHLISSYYYYDIGFFTGFTPAIVVGVVGIGHVPGIVENWGKMSHEDILELLRFAYR